MNEDDFSSLLKAVIALIDVLVLRRVLTVSDSLEVKRLLYKEATG